MTGGQDSLISVFALANSSEEPSLVLVGHTDNVCALHAAADGSIISGSWDKYVQQIAASFALFVLIAGAQDGQSLEKLPTSVRTHGAPAVSLGGARYRWADVSHWWERSLLEFANGEI